MKDLQTKIEMVEKKIDVYVEFYGWSSNETKALKDQLDQLNAAIIELMLLDQEEHEVGQINDASVSATLQKSTIRTETDGLTTTLELNHLWHKRG